MKSEILRLLKESDDYISGQQMCDRFHVSRTAVWKVVRQLIQEGYEIEAVNRKGYRLMKAPDVITASEIMSRMHTQSFGKKFFITMKWAPPIIRQNFWQSRAQIMAA